MRIFINMGGKILQFTRQARSKSSEKLQLSSNKPAAITTSRKGAQIANIAHFWTLSKLSTMLHLAHLLYVNFWHLYFSLKKSSRGKVNMWSLLLYQRCWLWTEFTVLFTTFLDWENLYQRIFKLIEKKKFLYKTNIFQGQEQIRWTWTLIIIV